MSKSTVKSADVVRVTSMINVGQKSYQPNDLVKNLPAADLEGLIKKGRVSTCEAGIKYCTEELKAVPIDHTAKPKTEEKESE